jgi:medium-chain acyl-[acyl-carrier-protein] hydrolase
MDARWLIGQEPDPGASFRLICLPYAGGSAAIYREWQAMAPGYLQVCPVELPGRGRRMLETPFLHMAPLVRDLAGSLNPFLDRPFGLFGHSLGGLIAFELTRALVQQGRPQPGHLFISAADAPGSPHSRPRLGSATKEDVKQELRSLGGTPQLLLDNEELMDLMMPTLRADFSVIETYEYQAGPPLPVPISVFAGTTDHVVPATNLDGWRHQSDRGYRLQFFPGDHFFLHTSGPGLLEAITQALELASAPQY